jgi:hypothetical protein
MKYDELLKRYYEDIKHKDVKEVYNLALNHRKNYEGKILPEAQKNMSDLNSLENLIDANTQTSAQNLYFLNALGVPLGPQPYLDYAKLNTTQRKLLNRHWKEWSPEFKEKFFSKYGIKDCYNKDGIFTIILKTEEEIKKVNDEHKRKMFNKYHSLVKNLIEETKENVLEDFSKIGSKDGIRTYISNYIDINQRNFELTDELISDLKKYSIIKTSGWEKIKKALLGS